MADDPVKWALPDFGACGAHAGGIGAAFGDAIEALKNTADMKETGDVEFPNAWTDIMANPMLCLGVYFVPFFGCCVMNRTLAVVDSSYEKECLNSLVTSILYCGPCYHASRRTAMRKKYNLKGSSGMDCLLSCFCGACLVCQEANAIYKLAGVHVPIVMQPAAKPAMPAPAPGPGTVPPPPPPGASPAAVPMNMPASQPPALLP